MRIRNTDISKLVSMLYAEMETGADIVLYKEDATYLTTDTVFTINRNNLGLDRDTFDIVPMIIALNNLRQNMSVFEGREGSWSVPIDPKLIEQNYHLGNQVITKEIFMNVENIKPENLASLEKTFLYSGMDGISRDELMRNMAEGKPSFILDLKEDFGDGRAAVKVHCELSAKGNYFADRYDLTVSQDGQPDYSREYKFQSPAMFMAKDKDGELKETWANSTVTLKEAYNQMSGRAINKNHVFINKEDKTKNRLYNAWEYIDFTKTDGKGVHPTERIYNYPVDKLEKELRAHPLMENKNAESFDNLVSSLRRGNVQSVSYIKEDGSFEKIYLKANPKEQTVSKYDQSMQPIILSLKREQEVKEKQQQNVQKKEGQKADATGDNVGQKQSRKNSVKVS